MKRAFGITVRVKMITGSLVTLETFFPPNYHYRSRLEIRMNSYNYHSCYRLGVCSDPLHFHGFPITILKVIWMNFAELPLPLPSWNVLELERQQFFRPEPPFTEVSGPSGHEIAKKSQKGCFRGGLQKSLIKYPKNLPGLSRGFGGL